MKFRFPGYRILDRYILGKFLATYFFAIAMIIVVVVLFDYVEKVDDFTELHAPLRKVIFDYYLNFIPFFINQFSGLFTFIACIFFTSKMAYQTEIVAMLSGGMSFRRLSAAANAPTRFLHKFPRSGFSAVRHTCCPNAYPTHSPALSARL